MNKKRLVVLYVNNSTSERFGSAILNGLKTVETRTKRATESFLKSGLKQGDVIGIAWNGKIQGVAEFLGIKEYNTASAFYADVAFHGVLPGCRYAYREDRGKYGILLQGARWYRDPVKVSQKHGRTWTEAD